MHWLRTGRKNTEKFESSRAKTVRKELHQKLYYMAMEATRKEDAARATWLYGIMKDLEKDGEVE